MRRSVNVVADIGTHQSVVPDTQGEDRELLEAASPPSSHNQPPP